MTTPTGGAQPEDIDQEVSRLAESQQQASHEDVLTDLDAKEAIGYDIEDPDAVISEEEGIS